MTQIIKDLYSLDSYEASTFGKKTAGFERWSTLVQYNKSDVQERLYGVANKHDEGKKMLEQYGIKDVEQFKQFVSEQFPKQEAATYETVGNFIYDTVKKKLDASGTPLMTKEKYLTKLASEKSFRDKVWDYAGKELGFDDRRAYDDFVDGYAANKRFVASEDAKAMESAILEYQQKNDPAMKFNQEEAAKPR